MNSILWLTRLPFEPLGVPRTNGGEHLLAGNRAARVSLHGVVDAGNLLPQPLLNRSVALLQSSQSGAHYFAARSVRARGDKGIGLFGSDCDGAFPVRL